MLVFVAGSVVFQGEMTASCRYPILAEVINYQSQESILVGFFSSNFKI